MNRHTFAIVLAGVITVAWIIADLVAIVRKDYTALTIITPVMLTVSAWIFLRRNGNGD